MRSDSRRRSPSRPPRAGFSLIEMMVTLVLLAIVVAVVATVMIGSQRSKAVTEGRLESQQSARTIAEILSNDIRSAGYQIDETTLPPQTPFAYVDSVEIVINANLNPFPDTLATSAGPQAMNPAGAPLPPVLDGTAYEPTVKYLTGAETIRYTLDLNDDGTIDADDQSDALATEVQRTRNPNDFVLARVVYGDSSANVALNNGGSKQKVGVVRGPGADVQPLFTVYLGSTPTPWDWNDGAIPQNRLDEISRIELRVTTEARRPGPDGTYSRAVLTSEINSIRNVPTAASTTYSVEGWVFNDLDRNLTQDAGEPGIPGAVVRLGTASVATSNALGYYRVSGPPAAYGLKQIPPEGYASFAADSLTIDFLTSPGDFQHSFADTARIGGWLVDTCFVDNDASLTYTVGDEVVNGVRVNIGGASDVSNGAGEIRVFVSPGSYSASYTAPESMVVVSTNPAPIVISNSMTTIHYTRLERSTTGTVTGTVYTDTNKNGTKDLGEAGIDSVWVAVTKDGGTATMAFGITDASGNFSLQAPNNMPAAVTPYEVTVIPPGNMYPTTSTQISPIWLSTGQTISGQNFGMSTFTIYSLTADRVLSLASGDLLEKDWSQPASQFATRASFDRDLILGSEYVSNPNVSVWFNRFDTQVVPFDPAPTYTRNAQSSALSVAVAQLDGNTPTVREDVVTGLYRKVSGNIAVWLNQNSSGNEGQLVTTPVLYQTQNAGDANVVVVRDFGGTTALDFIVGTTGAANQGTLETYINNGSGVFTRDEIYPPNGNLPSGACGEVRAIVFADAAGDSSKDLIIGTKIAPGSGRVHVLAFNTRVGGDRYKHTRSFDVTGEVTSMLAMNVDFDSVVDLVIGTRVSSTSGNIQYWRGLGSGTFVLAGTFLTDGPVLSLARGDFGGSSREDIVYGFRTNESAYAGGIRLLFLDLGNLPLNDVDPAGGTHDWMAPAITINNFNYRLNPTTSGTPLQDVVVATKTGATTGSLLVFIR